MKITSSTPWTAASALSPSAGRPASAAPLGGRGLASYVAVERSVTAPNASADGTAVPVAAPAPRPRGAPV